MYTNFITFRCTEDHRWTTDQYDTIQQASDASLANPPPSFVNNHSNCGTIDIIPIMGKAHIQVGCTECKYKYRYIINRKPKDVDIELKWITGSLQKGLFRKQIKAFGKCCRPNCDLCINAIRETSVKNKNGTNYTLPLFQCKISNCIYILQCSVCQAQYVGMTTTKLRIRFNNHKTSIKTLKTNSVSDHFNKIHSPQNLRLGILEHVPHATTRELRVKEAMWITLLDTVHNGLNVKDETNVVLDPHQINISRHYQHSRTCTPFITSWIEETKQNPVKN